MTAESKSGSSVAPYQLHIKCYENLPEISMPDPEGKFVLLSKGQDLHLVLSPLSLTPYHANIVYQYLQMEGRGKVEAVSSSGCRILSKGWHVHGGGFYQVQHWLHTLKFGGKSTAFGKYTASLLDPFREDIPVLLELTDYFLELK